MRKGPKTNERGWTQASVSESSIDDEDAIIPTVSDVVLLDISPILFTTSIILSIGNACKLLLRIVEDTITADDEWTGANPIHDEAVASSVMMDRSSLYMIKEGSSRSRDLVWDISVSVPWKLWKLFQINDFIFKSSDVIVVDYVCIRIRQ